MPDEATRAEQDAWFEQYFGEVLDRPAVKAVKAIMEHDLVRNEDTASYALRVGMVLGIISEMLNEFGLSVTDRGIDLKQP